MKKFVSCILVLLLCVGALALAESVPSKTTSDLVSFDVAVENLPADAQVVLQPLTPEAGAALVPDYQERLEICDNEVKKLAASENVESYFGTVVSAEGTPVSLSELLGSDQLNVHEFVPAVAQGFKEEYGKVTATMAFSTPYKEGEKVVVLIGIYNAFTKEVEWTAFEGVGANGGVQVTFTPEILQAIQNEKAMLAVVSK